MPMIYVVPLNTYRDYMSFHRFHLGSININNL